VSRILVVDDNAESRYLLQVLLAAHGYEVMVASDGLEALAQARSTPPDLAVADILMPGMDGWTLCREWRADTALGSVPFMFYTATYTEPKDEAFALGLGADRFLLKPQPPEVVVRAIEEVIRRGRPAAARRPGGEEEAVDVAAELRFLKQHRDAVIRKLEDKTAQLEAANAALRRDIAERERAEAAPRESEVRFHLLAEVSPVGIFQTDPRGATTYVNRRWTEISGLAAEEALGDGWLRAVHPEDRARLAGGWQVASRDGEASRADYRFLRPDGSVAWVIGQAAAFRDASGEVAGYVGTITDITDRAQAEDVRRRLAAAVDQAGEAVVVTDRDGTIEYVNPAFERITGYSLDEVRGRKPSVLKSGKQDEAFYRQLWETILDRRVWSGRLVNRRKDGSLYEEEATISPVVGEDGSIVNFVGVKRDVTAEEALRQQLTHAQKLEAVGRLAGGIAHDFNNVLQALLSQVAVLGLRLRGVPGAHKPLEELDQLVRRGAALTRQLLLFSRRETPSREPGDLSEIVRGAATLIRRVVRENVAIVTELSSRPLPVMIDRGQCDQVLMNLVVNASDAMPEGGTLTLRTGGDAETVWLAVTDTGCGISEQVRAHLFEPFFTTKLPGAGTGLGLSVVHGIATAHGGSVSVASREGAGATFTVTLPRLLEPPPQPVAGDEGAVVLAAHGERLLLVEDEDGARQGLLEVLGSLGYAVTAAASAEEALALPPSPPFDVLLTDLVLPGIAGPELARRLCERWPRLHVVVMSGHAQEESARALRTAIDAELLQKPFDIATLARAIRRVLGS